MLTVKENWNNRAKQYGWDAVGVIGTRGAVQEMQYQQTKTFLKDKVPTNKSILDYGCGVGRLSCLFKPELYTGMDISTEMLKIAKEKNQQYNYLPMGDMPKTDIVFTANVLQHNPDNFVKNWKPKAKELYLYEIIGSGNDKPHLFHRKIEDYEELLGLKCVKHWKLNSHTLMYFKNK